MFRTPYSGEENQLTGFRDKPETIVFDYSIGVVIPARNAAETIRTTLDSLRNQTHAGWKAVVIDDGSTDETRTIAESYSAVDNRITVIKGPAKGVSAARNAGIAEMTTGWLMFLDADDTIEPQMMAQMLAALESEPRADVAHCGWTYVDPDGVTFRKSRCTSTSTDLFDELARWCPFAIHACVIRRSFVVNAGGFQEGLRTAEDHDLWQRVARIGAHFIPVTEHLSHYHLRPQATWFDAGSFLKDVLSVSRRGHARDERLDDDVVVPKYVEGRAVAGLQDAEFILLTLAGAIAVARGTDPSPLFELVQSSAQAGIDEAQIAGVIFDAVPLALCKPISSWPTLWLELSAPTKALLDALETHAARPGLAVMALRKLNERILSERLDSETPSEGSIHLIIQGTIAAVRIDTDHPIPDLHVPGVDRLMLSIVCEGEELGVTSLPVIDGFVPSSVITDTIAAEYGWPLLECFFAKHIYATLSFQEDTDGWAVSRMGTILARGAPSKAPSAMWLRDNVGWTIFAQELTGLPDWPLAQICDPTVPSLQNEVEATASRGLIEIEGSGTLPTLIDVEASTEIEYTLGGIPGFRWRPATSCKTVTAAQLRAAMIDIGRMDLAKVAIREALIGRALNDPTSLRDRLQSRRAARPDAPRFSVIGATVPMERARQIASFAASAGLGAGGAVAVIGGAPGSGKSARRNSVPVSVLPTMLSRLESGQPALQIGDGAVTHAIYMPELAIGLESHEAPQELPTPLPAEDSTSRTLLQAGRKLYARLRHKTGNVVNIERHPVDVTAQLPILMYHRVSRAGAEPLKRWRVTPEKFDEQLAYLRSAGFEGATLKEWREAREAGQPLSGRRVVITFDDGYADFEEHALPILKRHGFTALIFLPTERVGDSANWDAWSGESAPLMDWDMARQLQAQGIQFGSHAATHRRLTDLSATEILEEGIKSRIALERELETRIDAIAYPFGAHDEMVLRLMASCGYRHGVTTLNGLSIPGEHDLGLSRLEIHYDLTVDQFAAGLSRPSPEEKRRTA